MAGLPDKQTAALNLGDTISIGGSTQLLKDTSLQTAELLFVLRLHTVPGRGLQLERWVRLVGPGDGLLRSFHDVLPGTELTHLVHINDASGISVIGKRVVVGKVNGEQITLEVY